jgi:hypothetical protein
MRRRNRINCSANFNFTSWHFKSCRRRDVAQHREWCKTRNQRKNLKKKRFCTLVCYSLFSTDKRVSYCIRKHFQSMHLYPISYTSLKSFLSFVHETDREKCVYSSSYTHPFMHRPRITLRWKLILKFLSATGSNISVPNYWKCRGVGTALCYSNTESLQVRFDRNVVFTSSTLLRASVSISLSIWRRGNYDMYKSQKGFIIQYAWTLYCSLNWSFSCYSAILRLCWCSDVESDSKKFPYSYLGLWF